MTRVVAFHIFGHRAMARPELWGLRTNIKLFPRNKQDYGCAWEAGTRDCLPEADLSVARPASRIRCITSRGLPWVGSEGAGPTPRHATDGVARYGRSRRPSLPHTKQGTSPHRGGAAKAMPRVNRGGDDLLNVLRTKQHATGVDVVAPTPGPRDRCRTKPSSAAHFAVTGRYAVEASGPASRSPFWR